MLCRGSVRFAPVRSWWLVGWVLPVVSGVCPVGQAVVVRWSVGFVVPSMVWRAGKAPRQVDALAKTG